jgi:hypothetical protein
MLRNKNHLERIMSQKKPQMRMKVKDVAVTLFIAKEHIPR